LTTQVRAALNPVLNAINEYMSDWREYGENWEEWLPLIIESRRLFGKMIGGATTGRDCLGPECY